MLQVSWQGLSRPGDRMAITRCRNKFDQYLWDMYHMSRAKFAHARNHWSCASCGKWFRYKNKDMRPDVSGAPWISTNRDICPKCRKKFKDSFKVTWDLVQTPPDATW